MSFVVTYCPLLCPTVLCCVTLSFVVLAILYCALLSFVQDSSALSTTSCARKISTVSVQQLPSHVGGAFSAQASASSLNISSTATGSARDDLGQVNGVSSRKTSGESTCKIPPENQITCAVEVHREKTTKTTTASTARAEQPAVAATTPTSTPRDSPAPTTRSPLPHELYHMRETIV